MYPSDVTTTNDLVDLKCSAAAGFGSCKELVDVPAPNGSTTTCTVVSVANAPIDELECNVTLVIGDPTSDNIALVNPSCMSME